MEKLEIKDLIVAAIIVYTLTISRQCCAAALPSSWVWPQEEINQRSFSFNKTSHLLSSSATRKMEREGSIRPKSLFAFGGIPARPKPIQIRQLGATPSSAVIGNGFGNCTCVPFFYCEEGQVASDGSGIIDIRQGWQCRSVLEVCCKAPLAPLTPSTGFGLGVIPTQNSQPSERTTTTSSTTTLPGLSLQCGMRHPNGIHARILGFANSETQFGEYPWQAAILEQSLIAGEWVFKFVCGAALIWTSVVVTAAHCVQGKDAGQLIIRLGEWDTQTTSEFLPHQDIWGSEIVTHPLYYSGGYYNDIALIFLRTPVILSHHINTICLPSNGPQPSIDGTSCWATGWGKNAFESDGKYQAILHEVELPLVPNNLCASLLRNTSLGEKFTFHESYLCAGGEEGRDSCVGDGGGPLVCPSLAHPWRYVLAGVTSWGIGCGTDGVPGVYADVSQFSAWIQAQISTKVPAFDPRQLEVDPKASERNSSHTTKSSWPQPYI